MGTYNKKTSKKNIIFIIILSILLLFFIINSDHKPENTEIEYYNNKLVLEYINKYKNTEERPPLKDIINRNLENSYIIFFLFF